MAKKENKKPKAEPSFTELESQGLDLQSQSLEAQASRELDADTLKIVKKISYYVSKVGLLLEEACLLVDVEYEWFKLLMQTSPVVRKIAQMKELEYKKDLLKTLSERARGGDDRLSQWLLERRYSDEFGNKKLKPGEMDNDFILEAVEFIQRTGDSLPMVKETSGRALIVKKGPVKIEGGNGQNVDSEAMKTLKRLLQ